MRVLPTGDTIKKFSKTSISTCSLSSGSSFRLGGSGYILDNELVLDTSVSGIGGIEGLLLPNAFYYVYAVNSLGAVYLIASTNEEKPSTFSLYNKVGAFYTDINSEILFAISKFGHIPEIVGERLWTNGSYTGTPNKVTNYTFAPEGNNDNGVIYYDTGDFIAKAPVLLTAGSKSTYNSDNNENTMYFYVLKNGTQYLVGMDDTEDNRSMGAGCTAKLYPETGDRFYMFGYRARIFQGSLTATLLTDEIATLNWN
jgi:hypothetical protein